MTLRTQHPRSAWPSTDDNVLFLGVILVGACAGFGLLWSNHHARISAAVMWWRHREILLLQYFTNRFDLADAQMRASDPAGVTLRHLYDISHAIGLAWRIPGALFVAALAALCLLRNAPSRFKRQFDLTRLIREQVPVFPAIAAFAGRQLRLVTPTQQSPRPADYALTPSEWIACHALAPDGSFDPARAHAALLEQLGPPWAGVEQASPQVRVLFAAFALHLAGRHDETLEVLGACSLALAPGGDLAEPGGPAEPLRLPAALVARIDTVLADRAGLVNPALSIAGRHAWTHPALMSLLNEARLRAGVLPPAQFAWLRLIDRTLWYALQSLGFESEGIGRYLHPNPRVEAAGARDHWAYERASGRPIVSPRFERALEALGQSHANAD